MSMDEVSPSQCAAESVDKAEKRLEDMSVLAAKHYSWLASATLAACAAVIHFLAPREYALWLLLLLPGFLASASLVLGGWALYGLRQKALADSLHCKFLVTMGGLLAVPEEVRGQLAVRMAELMFKAVGDAGSAIRRTEFGLRWQMILCLAAVITGAGTVVCIGLFGGH